MPGCLPVPRQQRLALGVLGLQHVRAEAAAVATGAPTARGRGRLEVVVSRRATDGLGWLGLLDGVEHSLWTESRAPARAGRNASRWRAKPLTRGGGTTRECGGYLGFVVENYDQLPDVAVFIHGEQSPHFTYAHAHSDPHIFHTIHAADLAPGHVDYCSLNFYYTDWREVGWHVNGWRRELASADPARFGQLLRTLPALPLGNGSACFCCAQFAVSRERLRAYPLEFYRQLLLFIMEDTGYNPWDDHMDPGLRDRSKNGRCDLMEERNTSVFAQPTAADMIILELDFADAVNGLGRL